MLVVAPVPLGDVTAHSELWGFGAAPDGIAAAGCACTGSWPRATASGFFDAGSVAQVSPLDGVHLDEAAHAALGAALADAVRAELARGG